MVDSQRRENTYFRTTAARVALHLSRGNLLSLGSDGRCKVELQERMKWKETEGLRRRPTGE